MKSRTRVGVLLILDLMMIAIESWVLMDEWRFSGARILRYYTQSSNLWALIACTICAIGEVLCLVRRRRLPRGLRVVRFVSACCLMVTLIVAACVLVPSDTSGSFRSFMLEGNLLWLHTVCPLTMLLAWLIHPGRRLSAGYALLAVAPTAVYGGVTLAMNIRRVYTGPYFFFQVYRQPVYMTAFWMAVILGGNFLLAWLLAQMGRRDKFCK